MAGGLPLVEDGVVDKVGESAAEGVKTELVSHEAESEAVGSVSHERGSVGMDSHATILFTRNYVEVVTGSNVGTRDVEGNGESRSGDKVGGEDNISIDGAIVAGRAVSHDFDAG